MRAAASLEQLYHSMVYMCPNSIYRWLLLHLTLRRAVHDPGTTHCVTYPTSLYAYTPRASYLYWICFNAFPHKLQLQTAYSAEIQLRINWQTGAVRAAWPHWSLFNHHQVRYNPNWFPLSLSLCLQLHSALPSARPNWFRSFGAGMTNGRGQNHVFNHLS